MYLIVVVVLSLSLSDSSLLCASCRSGQEAGEPANESFVFVFVLFTSVFYCCCNLVFVFV